MPKSRPSLFGVRRTPASVLIDGPLSYGYRTPIRNKSQQQTDLLYQYFGTRGGNAVITRDCDGCPLKANPYMSKRQSTRRRRAHAPRADAYTVMTPIRQECLRVRGLPLSIDPASTDRVATAHALLQKGIKEKMIDYLVGLSHKDIKRVMYEDVHAMCSMTRAVEGVISATTEGLFEFLRDGDIYHESQWMHQAPQMAMLSVGPVKRAFVDPSTQERYRAMLRATSGSVRQEDRLLLRSKFFRDVVTHPHHLARGWGFTFHKKKGGLRKLKDRELVPLTYDIDAILRADPEYNDLLKDEEVHDCHSFFFRCHTHSTRASFTDVRKTYRVDAKTGVVTFCELTPQRKRLYYMYSPKVALLYLNTRRAGDPQRAADKLLGRYKMVVRHPGEVPGKPAVVVFLKRLV